MTTAKVTAMSEASPGVGFCQVFVRLLSGKKSVSDITCARGIKGLQRICRVCQVFSGVETPGEFSKSNLAMENTVEATVNLSVNWT